MSPLLLSPICMFTHGQICHTVYSSAILTAKLLFVHNTFVLPWPISFTAPTLTFGLKNIPFSLEQTATVSSPLTQILQRKQSFTFLAGTSQTLRVVLHRHDSSFPFLIPAPIISSISRWGFRSGTMKSVSAALVKTLSHCPVGWHCRLSKLQHTSWLTIRVNEEHDDFSIQLLISNW